MTHDYSFLSEVTKCWPLICKTAFKTTAEISAFKWLKFMCNPMDNSRSTWSITHILPYFIGKGVCHDFIKYDEQFWPYFIFFAHYSKWILPQSASFSHAGTQMSENTASFSQLLWMDYIMETICRSKKNRYPHATPLMQLKYSTTTDLLNYNWIISYSNICVQDTWYIGL